jgi:hypothetical protein
MLNPADLLDALVLKLRAIPELVEEMGGAPTNIRAYHHRWPHVSYLQVALVQAKAPAILVVWRETRPGNIETAEAWQHDFSLIVLPREEATAEVEGEAAAYGRIFGLIVNGVPKDDTAEGNKLLNETIHSGCYPMNIPTFSRQTIMVSAEASMDYFDARIVLAEKGDN